MEGVGDIFSSEADDNMGRLGGWAKEPHTQDIHLWPIQAPRTVSSVAYVPDKGMSRLEEESARPLRLLMPSCRNFSSRAASWGAVATDLGWEVGTLQYAYLRRERVRCSGVSVAAQWQRRRGQKFTCAAAASADALIAAGAIKMPHVEQRGGRGTTANNMRRDREATISAVSFRANRNKHSPARSSISYCKYALLIVH